MQRGGDRDPPSNLVAKSIPQKKETSLSKENHKINVIHLNRPSTEGNSKVQLSDVLSRGSKSPTSPKSPTQAQNPTGQASLNEISLRTRSSLDPTSY
mmetsp:Transcript_37073/g.56872  ORF Transcript_37073/g.56872 Transcript_37073/m.56872 type:complete len:97 (+) Transcript_37073:2822-3112(+)